MSALRKQRQVRLVLCLLILVPCLLGQLAQGRDQDPAAIRVAVDLVMVDATVKNNSGQVMAGLTKNDFEIRDDGIPQKIGHFSRNELPLELVLLLDLSDSIGPYLAPLQDAARTVLGAMKPEDQVALVTFSDDPELRVPLTKDKDKISEALSSLKTGGLTGINEGLFFTADYLREASPHGRRVIVLISDNVGTDPGSHETRDIISEAVAADTAVYCLRVPGDNPKKGLFSSNRIRGVVDVRKVMEQTGGELFDVQDAPHLDATFRELMDRIKTRYTIGYYANDLNKTKEHKLDVRLTSMFGIKGRNYFILAKSGYTAP